MYLPLSLTLYKSASTKLKTDSTADFWIVIYKNYWKLYLALAPRKCCQEKPYLQKNGRIFLVIDNKRLRPQDSLVNWNQILVISNMTPNRPNLSFHLERQYSVETVRMESFFEIIWHLLIKIVLLNKVFIWPLNVCWKIIRWGINFSFFKYIQSYNSQTIRKIYRFKEIYNT